MVLLLLQCVESQSVEAASVYIASRALGRCPFPRRSRGAAARGSSPTQRLSLSRLNLARQAEERALGVPAAIELDR